MNKPKLDWAKIDEEEESKHLKLKAKTEISTYEREKKGNNPS